MTPKDVEDSPLELFDSDFNSIFNSANLLYYKKYILYDDKALIKSHFRSL